MEADITIASVRTFQTRGGSKRYVVRDSEGNEYTTFREHIGGSAMEHQGQPAHIEYHEEQRGDYRNVYLDRVEPIAPPAPASESSDTDPEEAAWPRRSTRRPGSWASPNHTPRHPLRSSTRHSSPSRTGSQKTSKSAIEPERT